MQSDVNLVFVGPSLATTSIAITSAAVGSTGILDMAAGTMLDTTSVTTYAKCPMTIGNASVFGEDLGVGPWRLTPFVTIGTAFTTGGTSLNVAWQGAVDASGGTYPANISGLTWTTYAETGAITTATLIAAGANAKIPTPDWPHRAIQAALPRFIRLLFTPVGTLATGTISFAGLVMPRADSPVGLYPSGFSVGS